HRPGDVRSSSRTARNGAPTNPRAPRRVRARPPPVHTGGVDTVDGTTTWVRTAEGWHEAPPTGALGRPPTGEGVPEGAVVWVRVPERAGFSAVAEQLGLLPEVVQRCAEHEHIRHRSRAHVEHLDRGMLLTVPTIAYRESTHDVLSGEVTCLALD